MAAMVPLKLFAAAAGTAVILAVAMLAGGDQSHPRLRDYLLRETDVGGEWSERFNIWEPANVERDCGADSVVAHASITFDREAEGRLVAHALTVWKDADCAWKLLGTSEAYQFAPANARPLSELTRTLGSESSAWRVEEQDGTVWDFVLMRRGDLMSSTWNEARTESELGETLRLAEAIAERLTSAEYRLREHQ